MSLGEDVACSESSTQPCSFLELFSLFNSFVRLYFTAIHRILQQNSLRGKLYATLFSIKLYTDKISNYSQ